MSATEAKTTVNKNETTLNIIKKIASLSPDKLVRGDAFENVEQRCLELCQTYIGGSWNNAKTKEDLTVKRISGGFTNQLYHVHLNESVARVPNAIYSNEPTDVAIKLYQEKLMKNYNLEDTERLNDTVILTIFGQIGLGPEIYGIFADGFIQAYYDHEQFHAKHQENPKLVREVMSMLARINHLSVPIRKEGNILFKEMGQSIDFAYANCRVQELAEELNLQTFKEFHVKREFEELMTRIEELKAPIVFTHSDFRGNNILVTSKDQRVLSVDMEYCGYGTRGYDFACLVSQWGRNDSFDAERPVLTDDSVIEHLLGIYIEEVDKLVPGYSSEPENSLEVHLREVKVMLLAVELIGLTLLLKQTKSIIPALPFDPKKKMQFVEGIFARYIELKNLVLKKGDIKKLD